MDGLATRLRQLQRERPDEFVAFLDECDAAEIAAITADLAELEYGRAATEAEARVLQSVEASRGWLYDPVGWIQSCIDWPADTGLAPYQVDVLQHLVDRRRVATRGPHGLGKGTTAALAVVWFAVSRDMAGMDWKVLTTASAWRHLSVYLWPEIHKWARLVDWERAGRSPFVDQSELMSLNLKLDSGAATAVASSRPELIEGAHADSLLYIIDEAKVVPNDTWDAIEGALAGGRTSGLPEAFVLALSTPGPPAGRFYDIHSRKPGFEDWHVRHVTLSEAIEAGRIAPEWAQQRRRQWGETSALYQNRVLGEFCASDEDAVIPLAWVEAAVERWHTWNSADRPPTTGKRVVAADIARSGADATVLAHRTGHVIAELEEHRLEDTMTTTARVQAALGESDQTERPTPIVDSAGIGAGVVDRLRELGVPVVAYTGAAKTTVHDRSREFGFVNVRSAAYWRLRELLDPAFDPQIALPPDDLLLTDLTAPTWEITTGIPPRIKIEPKDKLVARLGRSPDRGDAVAMAFWADHPGDQRGLVTVTVPPKDRMVRTGRVNVQPPAWGRPTNRNGNGNGIGAQAD